MASRVRPLEQSLGRAKMLNPNFRREAELFSSLNNQSLTKILAIRFEGLFWARNKVACSFEFGLWAWPLEASHYARAKASLTIFYWLFSAHFFRISTKFGHSTARPLDLDGHNVNRPLVGRDPSDSNSNRLHVDNFRLFFINLRFIL
jgi:hypothetical protein